jgi:hypothetical protein
MAKSKRKRVPKTVLKLPDLEQSKSAVLNSLTSASSKSSYEHAIREFIEWYCSEPRLAFNRTVVTRYRIALEQHPYAASTIMNQPALALFRFRVGWLWHRALSWRSQNGRVLWDRMRRLITRRLPPPSVCHPYPLRRMGVVT